MLLWGALDTGQLNRASSHPTGQRFHFLFLITSTLAKLRWRVAGQFCSRIWIFGLYRKYTKDVKDAVRDRVSLSLRSALSCLQHNHDRPSCLNFVFAVSDLGFEATSMNKASLTTVSYGPTGRKNITGSHTLRESELEPEISNWNLLDFAARCSFSLMFNLTQRHYPDGFGDAVASLVVRCANTDAPSSLLLVDKKDEETGFKPHYFFFQ